MNVKGVCLSGLVAALVGLGTVHGQQPQAPSGGTSTSTPYQTVPGGGATSDSRTSAGDTAQPSDSTATGGQGAPPPAPVNPGGLSSWLVYPRAPGCCGPVGGNGPIGSEVYLRTGASIPVGGGIFGDVLDVGWAIQGGGRALFFNPAANAAWTVDLSLSNYHYNANGDALGHTFTLFNVPAQVRTAGQQAQNVTLKSVDASG
jgi:hypothetical protein